MEDRHRRNQDLAFQEVVGSSEQVVDNSEPAADSSGQAGCSSAEAAGMPAGTADSHPETDIRPVPQGCLISFREAEAFQL